MGNQITPLAVDAYSRFMVDVFEARKISQYDVLRWKSLTRSDAMISMEFARKFVSYVEVECR